MHPLQTKPRAIHMEPVAARIFSSEPIEFRTCFIIPMSSANPVAYPHHFGRSLRLGRQGRERMNVALIQIRIVSHVAVDWTTEACGIVYATGAELRPPREIEGIAIGPYRACAPHFYPDNLRLLRPEFSARDLDRIAEDGIDWSGAQASSGCRYAHRSLHTH
jgi:hypothetical protein